MTRLGTEEVDEAVRRTLVNVPNVPPLVAAAEIAQLLGVSRQRVQQLPNDYADFPAPVADLQVGRIWLLSAVVQWAENRGRAVHLDALQDR